MAHSKEVKKINKEIDDLYKKIRANEVQKNILDNQIRAKLDNLENQKQLDFEKKNKDASWADLLKPQIKNHANRMTKFLEKKVKKESSGVAFVVPTVKSWTIFDQYSIGFSLSSKKENQPAQKQSFKNFLEKIEPYIESQKVEKIHKKLNKTISFSEKTKIKSLKIFYIDQDSIQSGDYALIKVEDGWNLAQRHCYSGKLSLVMNENGSLDSVLDFIGTHLTNYLGDINS